MRLVVLVQVFRLAGPGGGGTFPWLVYAAPNALFPLMTLFLWRSFSRCGAYAPLYTAGKCVALVSTVAFCIFSRQNMYTGFYLGLAGILLVLGSLVFLLAGDLFSVAGGIALSGKVRELEASAGTPAAGALPAETAGSGGVT
jgi:hypothetical protein